MDQDYEYFDCRGEVITRCKRHGEEFLSARGYFCVGCEAETDAE